MFGDSEARHDGSGQTSGHTSEETSEDHGPDAVDETEGGTELPTPPVTGDEAVDDAMMQLARSQAGSFAERIESGEHAHRALQSRLGGLGGA